MKEKNALLGKRRVWIDSGGKKNEREKGEKPKSKTRKFCQIKGKHMKIMRKKIT